MAELVKNDAALYRKFFKESAKLLGIHVQYRYPVDMDYTLHGQDSPLGYSEPIEMDVIFSESPKLKTLRLLGWVSEDPNDKPYIIQTAYDTPNLREGCLFELPSSIPGSTSKTFRVTNIEVNQIVPDSWYCRLVPFFEKKDALTPSDYVEKSYSYLKVNQDAT